MYRDDLKKMRNEIHELKTMAKTFQQQNCSCGCTAKLNPPAVHFLCGHSFNRSCLDIETECSICGPENRKILQQMRSMEESAEKHDEFFAQLQHHTDGFSLVSEYYGKGVFSSHPNSVLHKGN